MMLPHDTSYITVTSHRVAAWFTAKRERERIEGEERKEKSALSAEGDKPVEWTGKKNVTRTSCRTEEMLLYDWSAFSRGFAISIVTFGSIYYLAWTIISCPDKWMRWRRTNIVTSFSHAVISSILSIYWFVDRAIQGHMRDRSV